MPWGRLACRCRSLPARVGGVNFEKVLSYGSNIKWIFEAPRLTAEGRLLCVTTTRNEGPAILLWPGDDLLAQPEYIQVPEPDGASFPYGESTWYQLDSGRIMVFWRDEGASCRVYVNHSDDGGRTWSTPVLSDIPDSMSRLYAGRLSDGRYYLVNNAIATLLDRRPLMFAKYLLRPLPLGCRHLIHRLQNRSADLTSARIRSKSSTGSVSVPSRSKITASTFLFIILLF